MLHLSLAMGIAAIGPVRHVEAQEDLQPESGVFSDMRGPYPYHLAVREALIGGAPYRKCQLVAIPAFEEEWAVYLLRDKGNPPKIVFHRMRFQLAHEMERVISKDPTLFGRSLDPDAQTAALGRLEIDVDRFTAAVTKSTAEQLEAAWLGMLLRVQSPAHPTHGRDGVKYHFAHWSPGIYRSGETWSPREGSLGRTLVRLAESMCEFAESAPEDRKAKEEALAVAARDLSKRLEQRSTSGHHR